MLVSVLLLITGCSVKYNVVINEDLTLNEEAKLTGTDEFFSNYYKTTKTNVLKTMIEIYGDILSDKNYTYELVEDTTPYVKVNKKYDSVKDYVDNSILFNDYFDEVNYTEDGNIRRIETIGFNDNDPDNPERFNIKELEISITSPFKVKNHNAKNINKNTNTYYYQLNSKNDKIILEYDISRRYNPNTDKILMIIVCALIIIASWLAILILNKKSKKNS